MTATVSPASEPPRPTSPAASACSSSNDSPYAGASSHATPAKRSGRNSASTPELAAVEGAKCSAKQGVTEGCIPPLARVALHKTWCALRCPACGHRAQRTSAIIQRTSAIIESMSRGSRRILIGLREPVASPLRRRRHLARLDQALVRRFASGMSAAGGEAASFRTRRCYAQGGAVIRMLVHLRFALRVAPAHLQISLAEDEPTGAGMKVYGRSPVPPSVGADVCWWPPGRTVCWASLTLSRAAAATASGVMPNSV
jgi:hypothetical protein